MSVTKLIEYQQAYQAPITDASKTFANLKEDKFYLFNGGFFKWNAAENKWINADTQVYEYIDYLTGVEHEWNAGENQWKAKSSGSSSTTPANTSNASATVASTTSSAGTSSKAAASEKKAVDNKKPGTWFEIEDDKNTNVYVSGLPLDITDEEFEKLMSKYGVIMKDPITHKLKCKLYRENDEVKGDGRCCYLMVDLFFLQKCTRFNSNFCSILI